MGDIREPQLGPEDMGLAKEFFEGLEPLDESALANMSPELKQSLKDEIAYRLTLTGPAPKYEESQLSAEVVRFLGTRDDFHEDIKGRDEATLDAMTFGKLRDYLRLLSKE